MNAALEGVPVDRAMVTDFRSLSPSDPLSEAVRLILSGSQHDFPVEKQGTVVGVLTRNQLLKALAQGGLNLSVGEVMQQNVPIVDSSEMLKDGLAKLQECECHTLPVTRRGQLVGLVTTDNMAEFMLVQSALKGSLDEVDEVSLLPS